MDFDLIARITLDTVKHFQSAPSARAFNRIIGIGNLLEFLEHKTRHHSKPLDKVRFDQVRNASVNNHAGIEQDEIIGLILRREAHVRNNQRKILFVAAHSEDNPDVSKGQKK